MRGRNGWDAEWLTLEICEYYKDQAKDIKNRSVSDNRFMSLCRELIERCDITVSGKLYSIVVFLYFKFTIGTNRFRNVTSPVAIIYLYLYNHIIRVDFGHEVSPKVTES